jgi:flavin-dependent dehydrogenase
MEAQHAIPQGQVYDVVICGGGLAGQTLARQLHLTMPERSIAVVDRLVRPLPNAAFKVGESTTEAGSYYLTYMLDLVEYFDQQHLRKLGLRFFFGQPKDRIQDRPEFGLTEFQVVRSYNFDRGMLENDLRQFNIDAGITMFEGYNIEDMALTEGEDRHTVALKSMSPRQSHTAHNGASMEPQTLQLQTRWVVDATGRRRYIQKKLNLTKANPCPCSSSWFRLPGRIDIGDLVPEQATDWHERVPGKRRYYSTNHLAGTGYWVWIIPLSSGSTSIGIVTNDIHPFETYNTYQRAMQWLTTYEPRLADHIRGMEPMDFRCMREYTYTSRQVFSINRWACVGEAGAFADPLYSPGTDFIALGNSMVTEMIRQDFAGMLTAQTVQNYSQTLLALNDAITHNIQLSYPLFGTPAPMAAKVLWDTAAGWSLLSPQIYNSIFKDEALNNRVRKVKAGYFFLTQRLQQLLTDWGAKTSGRCEFRFIDFLNIPLFIDLRQRNLMPGKGADELVQDHVTNMEQLEEFAQAIFLVAVEDVLPEHFERVQSVPWLNAWRVSLDPEKWEADGLFQPKTPARDWSDIRQQIRSLYHIKSQMSESVLAPAAVAG